MPRLGNAAQVPSETMSTEERCPQICAVALAEPKCEVDQMVFRDKMREVYQNRITDLDRLLTMFDNSRISRRQLIRPIDWYLEPRSWADRNRVFLEAGTQLMVEASRSCLERAGCEPTDIDHIIFVNTTGLSCPTLDVYLIDELKMRRSTSRLPVWGLGCAAGAAAIARAGEYCRAHPRARVLIVALELCSLGFAREDAEVKDIVAASLFGDGAAAALVCGGEADSSGLHILDSSSYLFPDAHRMTGWDIDNSGMHVFLSPLLPGIIQLRFRPVLDSFLERHGIGIGDIRHFFIHAGGARVTDACCDALGLSREGLHLVRRVLNKHGNVSSVSVLAAIDEWSQTDERRHPGLGILAAFGPGFSTEMVLLAA